MAFELKSEIYAQINKTNDETLRTVLLLLLGVLEQSVAGMEAIGAKIDDLKNDEQALRKTVLNGLAATHEDDHHWRREHKAYHDETRALIGRAQPLMVWVEQQMRAEKERERSRKSLTAKLLEGAASQLGVIAATALATYAGIKYLG